MDSRGMTAKRQQMVKRQIQARGISDERVLVAMLEVERHLFVPEEFRAEAYEDYPLPIGGGQTISQPYIVGLMTQLGELKPGDRVLEIGTGSGYQAAVLARMGVEVYSTEIVEGLALEASWLLAELGCENVMVRHGDGYSGWPEQAPFDAVIVTAAPPDVPPALLDQLRTGGRLVIPVGEGSQDLMVISRTPGGFDRRSIIPVRFVPMVRGRGGSR